MKEYYKIINIISTFIDKYVDCDIIGKELIVIYDDIIPDLFVNIKIDDDIKKRYKLREGKIKEIMYDVYADRIKAVDVLFPNGEKKPFEVEYVIENEDNEYYSCEWQVPIIKYDFNSIFFNISLLDLIEKGAKVYIREYEGGII